MSTVKANAFLDASGGNTATINSMTPTGDSLQGFRNRIINGDMRIDQRNAGAAITQSSTTQYCLDRWQLLGQADGAYTAQRDTVAPSGFTNSLKIAVTTADASVTSAQRYVIYQSIEGFNVADLAWGTADAKTVTLSFWVRSSVTGTFSGALRNSAANRSYPFTYSISSSNTWEKKTVTVAGDTTGTWLTDNGIGIQLALSLGVGSSFQGTAGSWAAADYRGATGETQLINTLNATFYITGVQLEAGSVATPFERRPYGTELALCQRYYYRVGTNGATNVCLSFGVNCYNTTTAQAFISFPVQMRIPPTALETSGTAGHYQVATGSSVINGTSVPAIETSTNNCGAISIVVASGLTAGYSGWIRTTNTAAYLGWSAEL